jgi:hypothetical protein
MQDAATRYAGRDLFIAETSIEGRPRPQWLRYVTEEALAAIGMGVRLHGICLYPVISHIGWDEDRYCENGLFELQPKHGRRQVFAPLAAELARLQASLAAAGVPVPGCAAE